MKRDMDLIRALLLQIEEKDMGDSKWVQIDLLDWSRQQITEHLSLLAEAGLVSGSDCSSIGNRAYMPRRLTMSGHDFLDSIRDDGIWKRTKDGAEQAGGFTVDLLKDLAKGYIKTQIKNKTGIDV